ncbi:adenylyl-sulfate kinase [Moumouvirus australiensis]|uniref:adenylyl-sulfate kinase n=1 Tax=Moumouvirus australiensis TaxID=2109587 RepID=A0A2P1ELS9_9VIRU|nr:adenylyl-sulfate kinase [Moumouvirus australiensis]AVL94843.1 adenylyl-sulfate kinase [Moumouvirus australiensis]
MEKNKKLDIDSINFDKENIKLEDICNNYPILLLNNRQICDYEMITNGGFRPLTGFMTKDEYTSCINDMVLPNGDIWPIPINLHISEQWIKNNILDNNLLNQDQLSFDDIIEKNIFKNYLRFSHTVLKHETGLPLCLIENESIYKMDLFTEAKKVYNAITNGEIDINHPYVKILTDYQSEGLVYCLGGKLKLNKYPPHYDFTDLRNTPGELKIQFNNIGWTNNFNIVAFQTRNPLHKSHFMLTKYALNEATKSNGKPSKLLLHPVVGVTQPVDVDYHTRVKCYKELIKKYDNEAILSLLPLSMRMAGPREAVWHAIIRKNYGATHFVIGRDHAGPSYNRTNGGKFYKPYEAQELLLKYSEKIGINIITSQMIVFSMNKEKVYKIYSNLYEKPLDLITDKDIKNLDFLCKLSENDGIFKSINDIKEDEIYFEISGTEQRKLLKENKPIPNWFSYPEIIQLLRNEFSREKGIVFYLVGLSGSGKSTVANTLINIIKEYTFKPITYLDGDIVRLNLSKGLGFSKEDRSTNVRRIGYVCSEIARHGGICVVANIAPYISDRIYNKELIESVGAHYIEIFIDTSTVECEKRDVKGLYKLAREDKIKLTGINDPFDIPNNPDIHINGTDDLFNICKQLKEFININRLLN